MVSLFIDVEVQMYYDERGIGSICVSRDEWIKEPFFAESTWRKEVEGHWHLDRARLSTTLTHAAFTASATFWSPSPILSNLNGTHEEPGIRFDATFVEEASEVNYERNFRVQNRTVELALST